MAAVGAAVDPLGLRRRGTAVKVSAAEGAYEVYNGFVILPEDLAVPQFVRYPVEHPPALEGNGGSEGLRKTFPRAADPARYSGADLYVLSQAPDALREGETEVLASSAGNLIAVAMAYLAFSPRAVLAS
jgi:hypothetical protein